MVDGPEKVSGRAKYTADFIAPGMLAGRIFRSPYSHGEILEVDVSAAAKLPGVMAIVTGADCDKTFGVLPIARSEHPLARDRVRYCGEPVAAFTESSVVSAAISPELSSTAAPQLDTRDLAPEILAETHQPQFLAAPMTGPVIEGTVSLSEIEINSRNDMKVSEQPLQLAQLLPPASLGSQNIELPLSDTRDGLGSQGEIRKTASSSPEVAGSDNSPAQTAVSPMIPLEAGSAVSHPVPEKGDITDSGVADLLAAKAPEANTETLPRRDDTVLLAEVLSVLDPQPVAVEVVFAGVFHGPDVGNGRSLTHRRHSVTGRDRRMANERVRSPR
jgi:hypothetical protein